MKPVIIYTTPVCGYCKIAKEFFKDHDVAYKEVDVIQDAEAREHMISASGQMGVPVIDIGGELVIGFNLSKIKELLGIA
ncbi:MAG TPA: glutaredoxin domain-containing protein [Candidatus Paceibacterota bacterium]